MVDCPRHQTGRTPASDAAVPPIPLWLADLPTVGGMAIPWIAARTEEGRYLLGAVSQTRGAHALYGRLCGVCGRPLDDRDMGDPIVMLMRLSDLPRRLSSEPPLHPQCAAYTIAACPMVNGRLRRYRSTPFPLDSTMVKPPDMAARGGKPAEPWFAVWLRTYRVVAGQGHMAASYIGIEPLRIRPITWKPILDLLS
jgi:hypothetical protein